MVPCYVCRRRLLIPQHPQLDVTESKLQAIVQNDVSRWNNGLDTSGGNLEATKSSYYTLLWSFHPDGQPYLDDTSHQNPNPVFIDTAGNRGFLQYISPIQHSSEYKSLGVRMPGDLSNDYELQAIRVKCDRFAAFLTACPLTPQESSIAYNVYLSLIHISEPTRPY